METRGIAGNGHQEIYRNGRLVAESTGNCSDTILLVVEAEVLHEVVVRAFDRYDLYEARSDLPDRGSRWRIAHDRADFSEEDPEGW
ncbi:MAG: hypothetical protein R2751_19520 [Bacteroidales bacterium]